MSKLYKIILFILGLGLVLFLILFYYSFNPSTEVFFLKCPFKVLTGYDCPGCGSQRAIHSLLHGEIKTAYQFNPLLVLSIPYLLIGFLFNIESVKARFPQIRKIFFGQCAAYVIVSIIVLFGLFRNF